MDCLVEGQIMGAVSHNHVLFTDFISSAAFRHKKIHRNTWGPPSSNKERTQIDHIAISVKWHGCIKDCRSFWNTYVDSDHALVRYRFALRFLGKRQQQTKRLVLDRLFESEIKEAYQKELAEGISGDAQHGLDATWAKVSTAMLKAAFSACGYPGNQTRQDCISQRSMGLLAEKHHIPMGFNHNSVRRKLRRELKRSLRSDRDDSWITKGQEMEGAGNARNLGKGFQLIRSTGPRAMGVSEPIAERDGTDVTDRQRRLSRRAEYFTEQFS